MVIAGPASRSPEEVGARLARHRKAEGSRSPDRGRGGIKFTLFNECESMPRIDSSPRTTREMAKSAIEAKFYNIEGRAPTTDQANLFVVRTARR